MTNETLKPCPFCKGEAHYDSDTGSEDEYFIEWVGCQKCNAKIDTSEAWNTRPLEKQARIQAMQECLAFCRSANMPWECENDILKAIEKEKSDV
jgi:hypothetical protein